eukprot:5274920-Ditylum_brightwellii.AAC.1
MQVFLKTFDHQAVRYAWLQTSNKARIINMTGTRQMNLRIGFGWAESVSGKSQYYSSVPMGKACDGGTMHPHITHISHEVEFQILELTLPMLQQAFDVAEAVNPGIKKILKQYVNYLPFPHSLLPSEGGDRSNNYTSEHLKTISKENVRKLVNTEFSSYLHTDKRDIGCGS